MDEKVFFKQGSVKVTSARFINGGQTYAMSNVTSVKTFEQKPQRTGGVVAAIIGLVMLAAAPLIGAAIIGFAIYYLYQQKATYHVMLSTSAGESSALTTDHREYLEDVVEALNLAIVHRG